VGDKEEQERMREVRAQGMSEFRGSGLREGFRGKAEDRQRERRRRSGSIQKGEPLGHSLERVEERV